MAFNGMVKRDGMGMGMVDCLLDVWLVVSWIVHLLVPFGNNTTPVCTSVRRLCVVHVLHCCSYSWWLTERACFVEIVYLGIIITTTAAAASRGCLSRHRTIRYEYETTTWTLSLCFAFLCLQPHQPIVITCGLKSPDPRYSQDGGSLECLDLSLLLEPLTKDQTEEDCYFR